MRDPPFSWVGPSFISLRPTVLQQNLPSLHNSAFHFLRLDDMANVAVIPPDNRTIPSYNRVEPGSNQLAPASYPDVGPLPSVDANAVATEWVNAFNKALSAEDPSVVKGLFGQICCWRDQLGLSWDYHSLYGPERIVSFLKSAPKGSRVMSIQIDDSNATRKPTVAPIDFKGEIRGVASFLTVETPAFRGRGYVRIVAVSLHNGNKWKAFTLFTAMHELKGYEETIGKNRPQGVEHGGKLERKNWQERRTAMENYEGELEPTVLIIGAGQGGLTSAARLQQLQLPTLIIDKNPRVGDNWRNRYLTRNQNNIPSRLLTKSLLDITSLFSMTQSGTTIFRTFPSPLIGQSSLRKTSWRSGLNPMPA